MNSVSWRVRRIDADRWLPTEEVSGIDSVSISSATAKDAQLLQSGDMDVTGSLEEGYYRIECLPETGELINIATLLFVPDGAEYRFGTWGGGAIGKSVLAPASERKFKPGQYAPKGVDAAKYCAGLLRDTIKAPVVVKDDFKLGDHVVFDLGTSYLDGIWKVLDAGNFCMQIAGDGTVSIMAQPTEPDLIITAANINLIMPEVTKSLPIDDVPNVLYCYDDEQEAIARNDNATSATSTSTRGREIEEVEDSPTRKEGETLQQYADRRLGELGEIYETYDIEREYVAGIYPYSMIRSNLGDTGINGDFRVMSQTLECGRGIKVGETWGRKA